MTVTIKDVAQAAGVSITTVSRVLSNKGSFYSEKTARKVKKTAEKLGYQKNTAAAELATQKRKRTFRIALSKAFNRKPMNTILAPLLCMQGSGMHKCSTGPFKP